MENKFSKFTPVVSEPSGRMTSMFRPKSEKKFKLVKIQQDNPMVYQDGHSLYDMGFYQIEALKDFSDVKKGDRGGYVQSESNLSQDGDCWIYDTSIVYENAKVCGDAKITDGSRIRGNAEISVRAKVHDCKIYDKVCVWEDAEVTSCVLKDSCFIAGKAKIFGPSILIEGNAKISGNAVIDSTLRLLDENYNREYIIIKDDAEVCGDATIDGIVEISGQSRVFGHAKIEGYYDTCKKRLGITIGSRSRIFDHAKVDGFCIIIGDAMVYGEAEVTDWSELNQDAHVLGNATISGESHILGDSIIDGSAEISESRIVNSKLSNCHTFRCEFYNENYSRGTYIGNELMSYVDDEE